MEYNVYKITNMVNGKIYIGYTSQTLNRRFNQHKAKSKTNNLDNLHKAIVKYGFNNFKIELISSHNEMIDALNNEKKLIAEYNTIKNGYNISSGGEWGSKEKPTLRGRSLSETHKKNISKNHHDISGEKNPFYGKKHTLESRLKISKNHADISGAKNPMYGKKTASSFKSGKEHPNSKPIKINGIEYSSITEACNTLHITRHTAIKLRS